MNTIAMPVQGPIETIPVARSETDAVLHMIERAARDPAVDVEKLRQLMELREKAEIRQAERDFNDAMSAAQTEMGRVRADASNPQTRSKYASYAAMDRSLRPVYTAKGFSLSFDTEDDAPADHVRVVCYVSAFGHTRKYRINMPADGKGARGGDVMTKTHAMGSAVSYGSRYLLKMIFNVAVGEDDDDGNKAGFTPRQNPHVTRPSDIVPPTEYDVNGEIIDNIPEPSPEAIQKLRVVDQRPIFKALQDEINATSHSAQLQLWAKDNADRLGSLKPDWRDILRGIYTDQLDALRAQEDADELRMGR